MKRDKERLREMERNAVGGSSRQQVGGGISNNSSGEHVAYQIHGVVVLDVLLWP
jgi:FAD/FMN-containing dehydrogenase